MWGRVLTIGIALLAASETAARGAQRVEWCAEAEACLEELTYAERLATEAAARAAWQQVAWCAEGNMSDDGGTCQLKVAWEVKRTPKPESHEECDGVTCSPIDAPLLPPPLTFSHAQPMAIAAGPPPFFDEAGPALAAVTRVTHPGYSRRLDRPPRA